MSFLLLAVLPLIIVGSITGYHSTGRLEQQTIAHQREVVSRVLREITAFVEQRTNELRLLDDVVGIGTLAETEQVNLFEGLLLKNQHYQTFSVLETSGEQRFHLSRTQVTQHEDQVDRGDTPEFNVPFVNRQIYYGPIQFNLTLREPLLRVSLPIIDRRTDEVNVVVVADVRVKPIWEVLASIALPNAMDVAVLDSSGRVVAHKNPAQVLRGARYSGLDDEGQYHHPETGELIYVRQALLLGTLELQVVAMQPLASALRLVHENIVIGLAVTIVGVIGAIILGLVLTRQIAMPIEYLARYVRHIGLGESGQGFMPSGVREVRELGIAFDQMNRRLSSIITDLEQATYDATELSQATLESIDGAVITTNAEGRVNYLNPAARELTGWTLSGVCGLPLDSILPGVDRHQCSNGSTTFDNRDTQRRFERSTIDPLLITCWGKERAVQITTALLSGREGNVLGLVLALSDVTYSHQQTQELRHQATHDALTGLINRRELDVRLQTAIESAHQQRRQHVLVYLDLDRFKEINDNCGHDAGDKLLCQVTALFGGYVRGRDTLARVGGDEFCILMEDCSQDHALRVLRLMRQALQKHAFQWGSRTFHIGVSMGLAVVDASMVSTSIGLQQADQACYMAKFRQQGGIEVFNHTMSAELARRKQSAA